MLKSLQLRMNKLRSKKVYKVETIVTMFNTDKIIELRIEANGKTEAINVAQQHIAGNISMTTKNINRIKK